MNVTFKKVTGLKGLEKIKWEWELLTDQHCPSFFFHKWIWYNSFLVNLVQDPENIYFVLMYDDGVPVCILPFEQYYEKKGGIRFRALRFPFHSHINFSDIITGDSNETCSIALIDYLRSVNDPEWDVFFATKLLEDSPVIQSITKRNKDTVFLQQTARSSYVQCDAEYNYMDDLPSKFRRNIRRLKKRADSKGKISFHYVNNREELPSAFEEFLRVESSGWKGLGGSESAIALCPKLKGFYTDVMESFSAIDECQINLIKIDDKCIGAQFCLIQDKVLYILKIGYDEYFKDIAPGSLLLFDLICKSIDNSNISIISLVTSPPWAKRWHLQEKKIYRVIFTNKTIKGSLYNFFCEMKK